MGMYLILAHSLGNKHGNVGWLLLMWLNKGERKGWAQDSNSQLRLHVNDPKVYVCPEGDLRLGLQTPFLPICPSHLNITEKTLLSPDLNACLFTLSALTWLSLNTSRSIFLCFPLPGSSLIWPFLHENNGQHAHLPSSPHISSKSVPPL